MPELPEVETTVNGLNKKVLNRTFVDIWSDWKKLIKKPNNFEKFKKELKGKKVKKVWRRAKNIIFDLSSDYSLLIHQKMTGHILVGGWKLENRIWKPIKNGPLSEKINLYIHLLFKLDNGEMIALSDVRKFAKAELWKTKDLLNSKEFMGLGPEPLEKDFSFKKFQNLFKGKKGKVKQIIMKPEFIAGIGNIYASEALWWAKIHPGKDISKLNEKELKSLYNSIRKVLTKGIKLGGDSFSDYRNVEGKKGDFEDESRVYQKENEKCVRCKTLIEKIIIGGRSSFFCPHCQTLNSKS